MRRLLLIRHAKSSHKFDELDDHERPLNKRGDRDAIAMARFIAEQNESLDVIYSSTAIRALDFAQVISDFSAISLVPDLSFYTFDPDELIEILKSLPDTAYAVAIILHNPAVTQVLNRLTNGQIKKIPTAGVAAINCPVDQWSDILEVQAELDYFVSPKILS